MTVQNKNYNLKTILLFFFHTFEIRDLLCGRSGI